MKTRGPTANQSGETIKITTQTCNVIKTVCQKYIKAFVRVGYAPPVWKRAQVQGLKESRLTIRGHEDQDLVFYEEVGQVPSYSPYRLFSRSAFALETIFIDVCERVYEKFSLYAPIYFGWTSCLISFA